MALAATVYFVCPARTGLGMDDRQRGLPCTRSDMTCAVDASSHEAHTDACLYLLCTCCSRDHACDGPITLLHIVFEPLATDVHQRSIVWRHRGVPFHPFDTIQYISTSLEGNLCRCACQGTASHTVPFPRCK